MLSFAEGRNHAYLEKITFAQVWEMVDYPSPGIKKAAIAAIGQFCCSLAKVTQSAQSEEGLAGEAKQNGKKQTRNPR